MPKGFTVRLDDEQAADLEAVARVDGTSVSEEIRSAIDARIAERRKDDEFQERLNRMMEQNKRVLDRLAQ